jgi:hypothetical protein
VLVTTSHRGVFFGYEQTSLKRGNVTLTDARNCLYWSADVKGFMGLAASGPSKSCRVGPAVKSITLTGVTSVAAVNADAEKRWTDAAWS